MHVNESSENYLETILMLSKKLPVVRAVDIATELNFKKSSVIAGTNGERYDRAIATRGNDYLLVYNYSGRPMQIDLSKISGAKKNAWWYSAKDGKLEYIGEFDSKVTPFQHDSGYLSGNDQVLIVVDSAKDYVQKAWTALPDAIQKWNK